MNRNVHGRHFHIYYSLYILFAQICKRYIVSLQKRKSGIVILEVYAFSHSARVLVYKAKYAVVCTAPFLVHKIGGKIKTYIVVLALFYLYGKLLLAATQRKSKILFAHIKTIVKHVRNSLAAYAHESVACGYSRFFGGRTFFNARYFNHKKSSIKQFRQV